MATPKKSEPCGLHPKTLKALEVGAGESPAIKSSLAYPPYLADCPLGECFDGLCDGDCIANPLSKVDESSSPNDDKYMIERKSRLEKYIKRHGIKLDELVRKKEGFESAYIHSNRVWVKMQLGGVFDPLLVDLIGRLRSLDEEARNDKKAQIEEEVETWKEYRAVYEVATRSRDSEFFRQVAFLLVQPLINLSFFVDPEDLKERPKAHHVVQIYRYFLRRKKRVPTKNELHSCFKDLGVPMPVDNIVKSLENNELPFLSIKTGRKPKRNSRFLKYYD